MSSKLCLTFFILILAILMHADFTQITPLIEMGDNEFFYFDNEHGFCTHEEYSTYVIIHFDQSENISSLRIYRSDNSGETYTQEDIYTWNSIPSPGLWSMITAYNDEYFYPRVFTSAIGEIRVFYEDLNTKEIMCAVADSYWQDFYIEESIVTDDFGYPFIWQSGQDIWSVASNNSPAAISNFQDYVYKMIVETSDQGISSFMGFHELQGEVYSSTDIWIRQIGGGDNNGWPMFDDIVLSGERIMNYATYAPAVDSAPMCDIFRGGYLEEYGELMGDIDRLPCEVWQNGFIIYESYNRDILFAKIVGNFAELRFADIIYEDMDFTVYNSYPDAMHPQWAIGDSIWTNSLQVPHIDWDETTYNIHVDSSSVYCDCQLWIEGEISGFQTWVCGDTVYITNDITYDSVEYPDEITIDCPDLFGLISLERILYKYKHFDPWTQQIEAHNCDGLLLYGSYAALGEADPNSPFPGYEDGVITFEYQHPHGSTPDFSGVSPFTGNDTLFTYIDLHKYVMPPADGYTGDPDFILHSNYPPVGYPCCGYPYENSDYNNPATAPYGTELPFYNPVYPESSEDIVFDRGTVELFGSMAQIRRGFHHRSGTDPHNHDNNIIDHSQHLYGGEHDPVGYMLERNGDCRLQNNIYPPDMVKVINYFRVQTSTIQQAEFSLDEQQLMGEKQFKALQYSKILGASNSGEDFAAVYLYENYVLMIIYNDGEDIKTDYMAVQDMISCSSKLRGLHRDGDMLFVQMENELYLTELGSLTEQIIYENQPADKCYDIFWNINGECILLELPENSNTIEVSILDEQSLEFNYLTEYSLEGAQELYADYMKIDFDGVCQHNGEINSYLCVKEDIAHTYYKNLYQLQGEIDILPQDDDEIASPAFACKLYPNPFNPSLTIACETPDACEVKISIYNLKGEKVLSLAEQSTSGSNWEYQWNGRDRHGNICASGVYLVKLQAGAEKAFARAVMIK